MVDELTESIERERQRGHDAKMLLEGAVSKGGVVLPEVRLAINPGLDLRLPLTRGGSKGLAHHRPVRKPLPGTVYCILYSGRTPTAVTKYY